MITVTQLETTILQAASPKLRAFMKRKRAQILPLLQQAVDTINAKRAARTVDPELPPQDLTWFQPYVSEEEGLYSNYDPDQQPESGVIKRAREVLRRSINVPFLIKKKVKVTPEDRITARVQIVRKDDKVTLADVTWSVGPIFDMKIPVGRVPDGVEVLYNGLKMIVKGPSPARRYGNYEVRLAPLEGAPFGRSEYGYKSANWGSVSPDTLVIPTSARMSNLRAWENGALRFAMTKAVHDAIRCEKGLGRFCPDGAVKAAPWPPKPRSRSGEYTAKEWSGHLKNAALSAEVKELMAQLSRAFGSHAANDYRENVYYSLDARTSWGSFEQQKYGTKLTPDTLRAVVLDATINPYNQTVERYTFLQAPERGTETPQQLLDRARKVEPVSVEDLKLLLQRKHPELPGVPWNGYRSGRENKVDIYDLASGRATIADLLKERRAEADQIAARKRKEKARTAHDMKWAKKYVIPLVDKYKMAHAPTRSRKLKALGLKPSVTTGIRGSRRRWTFRLGGDAEKIPHRKRTDQFWLIGPDAPTEDGAWEAFVEMIRTGEKSDTMKRLYG